MKRALKLHKNTDVQRLVPYIKKNVGLIFTNSDLLEIKNLLQMNRVAAVAKAGIVAPSDVIVPHGDTGLEPTQTSFLQALNIPTRISKRQIEIITDFHLIKKGERVGSSEATLLQKLNIKPFEYGMEMSVIYDDGAVFKPDLLEITPEQIHESISSGVANLTAVSLALGFTTQLSVPYVIHNSVQNMICASVGTGFRIPQTESLLNLLENPEALQELLAQQQAAQEQVVETQATNDNDNANDDDQGSGDDSGSDLFGGGGLFD